MYRLWNFLRMICKDVFWFLLGLAVLFFVFMVARDVWYRAGSPYSVYTEPSLRTNPVMKRIVPQVEIRIMEDSNVYS